MRLRSLLPVVLLVSGSVPAVAGSSPGRSYAVVGAPLVVGAHEAGRTVSVYTHPQAVGVSGCRTSHVRVRGGVASASVVCAGARGTFQLRLTLHGASVTGTLRSGRTLRRFTARAVTPPGGTLHGAGPVTGAIGRVVDAIRHGDDVDAGRVVRTEVAVTFRAAATVATANAALAQVGGRVVGSLPHDRRVAVAIADPGSLFALNQVLAVLRRAPAVEAATVATISAPADLPTGMTVPLAVTESAALAHLLAIRMPAAWNVRSLLKPADQPAVVVEDLFGAGAPSPHLDAVVSGDLGPKQDPAHRVIPPDDHGYHVIGTIAADFADDLSNAGTVTGVFPGTTRMVAVDWAGLTDIASDQATIAAAVAAPGRVILNTSIQRGAPTTTARSLDAGIAWADSVRAAGLEDRLLQLTAAGNHSSTAALDSPYAPALRADLRRATGAVVAPLTDLLAVENATVSTTAETDLACLDSTSSSGGTVAAPGDDVVSFDHLGKPLTLSGTSMATPVVAGLAEYLWTLAPDLSPRRIRRLLTDTAAAPVAGCTTATSAPRLDAYAATLSLDEAGPLSPGRDPIRLALLDRNHDGLFDQADLEAWADVLTPTTATVTHDWGRADINGDGDTGGAHTMPFDLDRDGSTRAGAALLTNITANIEGRPTTFHENALTDAEIVCYYAYSPLYTPPSNPADDQRSILVLPDLDCPPDTSRNEILYRVAAPPAYVDYEIRATRPDGSGTTTLFTTHQGGPCTESSAALVPSHDGSRFLCGGVSAPFVVVDRAGTILHTFTPATAANPRCRFPRGALAWTPDDLSIVYSSYGVTVASVLCVVPAAGGEPRVLSTSIPGCCDPTSIAFSPDGTRVAYSTSRATTNDVEVVSLATGRATRVLTNARFLDWSPDGSLLLVETIDPKGNTSGVSLTAPDGTGAIQVVGNGDPIVGPWPVTAAFSGDGKSIVVHELSNIDLPGQPFIRVESLVIHDLLGNTLRTVYTGQNAVATIFAFAWVR